MTEDVGSRGSLCGMSTPEIARLKGRADEQDSSIRAVSDTVIEIKETVDQHTEELANIRQTVGQHTGLLNQHTGMLSQHTELLNEILRRLDAR